MWSRKNHLFGCIDMKCTNCEYAQWHVLPIIRKGIIASMVKDYGLNQKEAAKKLCISPAAVSQYLSGKRGILHAISPELMYEFKISAGRIIDNGDEVIIAETCRLCKLIISKDYFLQQSEK